MPIFYRFINRSERKQLWSIVLFEIILVISTWFYIEKIQFNNECYKTLKHDYDFISLYIDVPHYCTWWNLLWFRINRYTIYTAYAVVVHVLLYYDISIRYTVTHLCICIGLLYNILQAEQEANFFYRDAPILFHTLILVLNLQNQPFDDSETAIRWTEIDMQNDERLLAQDRATSQSWSQAFYKIRQCDSIDEVKQIIRQADEEEARIRIRYSLLNNPVLSPPKYKKNIFLSIFTHTATFLLLIFAVWSCISLVRREFTVSSSQRNSTQTM